ncbi:MAG: hypothetical protein HY611_05735 [Elusimicrobia bacterium]|nr:hypothetical protein [Elusimicrobiota bacterium]
MKVNMANEQENTKIPTANQTTVQESTMNIVSNKSDKAARTAPRTFWAGMHEVAQDFEKQLAPILQMQKRILESGRPFLEAQERMQKMFDPLLETQRQIELSVQRALAMVDTEYVRHIDAFIRQLQEKAKTLPERTRKALLVFGKHGWFPDLEMATLGLWELEKALIAGDTAEAEKALIVYYREKSANIVENTGVRFPKRAKILGAAFAAHGRGEYELSIPVFLAQADGIFKELFGIQLWKIRSENKIVEAIIQRTCPDDEVRAAFFYPLMQMLPISATTRERGSDFNELNRHQVLHGESVDYGSETNSLKAISLLNYISVVLQGNDANISEN